MIKVIETNISLSENGEMVDHQARVIEVDSWESFVEEVKTATCVHRNGSMVGCTVPRNSKVVDFVSDDYKLSCEIYNYCNARTKKLAYLISE